MVSQNEGFQVFVTRFGPDTTENDLRDEFSKFGNLKSVLMKPKYCFIEFEREADCLEALAKMPDFKLNGYNLVVQKASCLITRRKRTSSRKKKDLKRQSQATAQ